MSDMTEIRKTLKGKKLLVVPYMHADWAWCHTREWHARRYIAVFEDLLELLEKDTGYKWYMDCFCTEIGPLLERRPDLIPKIRKFVQRGDIQIAGGYANVRPNMVGEEAYIRNMVIGREEFLRYFPEAEIIVQGEAVDTALGHPQIPQLISKAGFRYYRAGRPYEVMEKKGLERAFFWEGLDGTAVLVWWGEYGGMWEPEKVRRLLDRLGDWDQLLTELYDTELQAYLRNTRTKTIWVGQGSDDALPLKAFNADLDVPLPEIIRQWNEREDCEIAFAGPNDFFRALEQERDHIDTHAGAVDICDVCYNVAFGGEKGLAGRRMQSSERLAETEIWESLNGITGGERAGSMEDMWKETLNASCHATAWLFTDDFAALSERMDKALLDAKYRKRAALEAMTRRVRKLDGCVAVVYNSLSKERTAVVSVTVPCGQKQGVRFVDGEGRTLPHQWLKAYEYTDTVWEHEALVQLQVPAMGYNQIALCGAKTDCRHGDVFVRAEKPRVFRTDETFELNSGLLRLRFEGGRLAEIEDTGTGEVYGCGEAAWNDVVFDEIDTDNGVLHAGPMVSRSVARFEEASVVENGPVRWKVVLKGSDGRVAYTQEIAITKDSRDIEYCLKFDWPVSRGRLMSRIPVSGDCVLRGGIPFGSEAKDVDGEPYKSGDWDDMHRQWPGLFCAKDYVRAIDGRRSAALMSLEGDRFFMLDRETRALSYVLLNSVKLIEGTWEDGVNRFSTESVGSHAIRYAVRIGALDEPDRRAAEAALELRSPVDACIPYCGTDAPALPETASLAGILPENLRATALYRRGEEYMFRFYETDGREGEAEIRFPRPVKGCESQDFIGNTDGREVTVEGNRVRCRVRPHEIVTLALTFE